MKRGLHGAREMGLLMLVFFSLGLMPAYAFEVDLDLDVQSNRVVASWTKYTGGDLKYYKLLRNTFPGAEYPADGYLFYSTNPSVTTYTDGDPLGGVSYYRVCVVLDSGHKYYSTSVRVELEEQPDPEGPELSVAVQGDGTVFLEWTKFNGSGFKYYKVLRNDFPGAEYPQDGYLAVIGSRDTLSYTDESPMSGVWYYRICAVTQSGKYYSPSVRVELEEQPDPEGPELSVAVQGDGTVFLEWTRFNGSGFKYYKVLRNDFPGAEYPQDGYLAVIGSRDTLSYTDESPMSGVWYYRICAVTQSGKYYSSSVPVDSGDAPDDLKISISADPLYGTAPLEVTFKAQTEAENCTFSWFFGDGEERSGAEATHVYQASGSYVVTLTAENGSGQTGQDTMTIRVLSGNGTGYVYILPYYTSRPNEWSGIGLTNESWKTEADIRLEVFDQSGNPQSVENAYFSVPSQGQTAKVVDTANASCTGWMRIVSDCPLSGLSFFGTVGIGNYMADIPIVGETSQFLRIPHVAQDHQWNTTILLCNPNAEQMEVQLTYVDPEGLDQGAKYVSLPALGAATVNLTEISDAAEGKGGSVRIVSSHALAAFALYENLKFGGRCHAGITAVPIEGEIPDDPFE